MGRFTYPPLSPLLETPLIRKPLKFSRTPFTTVLAPFSYITPVAFTAPGACWIRSYTLRPFKGKLAICLAPTVSESLALSVFTRTAPPTNLNSLHLSTYGQLEINPLNGAGIQDEFGLDHGLESSY